jgi:hypothetical protein
MPVVLLQAHLLFEALQQRQPLGLSAPVRIPVRLLKLLKLLLNLADGLLR